MSENDVVNALFLTLFLGLVWGYFFQFFLSKLIVNLSVWKMHRRAKAEYKTLMKNKEEMLARGELHEWIKIPTYNGHVLACKKTGWCPELKDFFRMGYINRLLMHREIEERQNKEWEAWKEVQYKKIAESFAIPEEQIKGIVKSGFEMKKEFVLDLQKRQEIEAEKQIEETRRRIAKK